MIRILEKRNYNNDTAFYVFAGNSLDTPPTEGVLTGSEFFEVDTGRESYFDEQTGTWYPGANASKTLLADATITLGDALVYDGTEQTQAIASVVIGETELTENTDYTVEGNKATLPGAYKMTLHGIGSYAGMAQKTFTVSKGEGSVSVDPATLTLTAEGDSGTSAVTVTGDGAVTVASNHDDIASAVIDSGVVTVTPVAEGSATVTVTLADSDLYTGDTATIAVTVEAAANPDSND